MKGLIPVLLLTGAICLLGVLVYKLRKNLQKTIYDYRNIVYLSALLYTGVLTVILLTELGPLTMEEAGEASENLLRTILNFPRKFSTAALLPMGVLSLLLIVSNLALMRHEGTRPANMLGLFIGGVTVGGTLMLSFVENRMYGLLLANGITENRVLGVVYTDGLLFIWMLLCYFECILVGTGILGYLAARQKPAYDKDFIIIPGCRISKEGGLLPLIKGRTLRAIRYAWDQEIASGRPVKYVPSGGQGNDEVMSEGSAMALFLLSHGAEEDEVFPEKQSKNTRENFLFSKKIIDGINPSAKTAFATTNYHMLRSGMLAREVGFSKIEGIASGTKWYFWPNGFVREFIAILAMHKKSHFIFIAAAGALCVLGALGFGFFGG